ncbi:nucleoside 2-deoxyribosyltransferase [Paraburkholderia xenovorans]
MSGAQHDVVKARIYLAGFDVFRVDALDYGRSLQRMCADAGFEGLYPLDALVPADLSPQEKAAWIYRSNLAAIGRADMVMANVADFRGAGEPDSGTAFEIGFAAALGKPIWAGLQRRCHRVARARSMQRNRARRCLRTRISGRGFRAFPQPHARVRRHDRLGRSAGMPACYLRRL